MLVNSYILEKFGTYELLKRIHVGNISEVFIAKKENDDNFYILKRNLLSGNVTYAKKYLEREFHLLKLMNSEYIVKPHEDGIYFDFYFFTTELIMGFTLKDIYKKLCKINPAAYQTEIMIIAFHILEALKLIHSKDLNILHKDITPDNIMVSVNGITKILDFDIAQDISTETATCCEGKIAYMSPEQIEGYFVDHRSDLFSLGILLWELLAGRRLFFDKDRETTKSNVLKSKIIPLHLLREDIDEEVSNFVGKLLNRDINKRFKNARIAQKAAYSYLWKRRIFKVQYSERLKNFLEEIFPGYQEETDPLSFLLKKNELMETQGEETTTRILTSNSSHKNNGTDHDRKTV